MEKIKIITDSTADIIPSIVEKYGIEVLPLTIFFGEKSYMDCIDINLPTLLQKIEEGNSFPTTSQVNPQRFYECFKRYTEEGYKIISIHLSSKLSGTYQSACIAKDMLETDDIAVIDSVNVTAGLGLLVIKACMLRDSGKSFEEIQEEIKATIPHVKSVLPFETLDNLVKGGRLSKAAGVMGNILGIKPVMTVQNGEMVVMGKVRGSKKALRSITDYMDEHKIKSGDPFMLLHVENKDILQGLRDSLTERKIEFIECEVGCTVGVYAGAGAIGVFFVEDF